MSNRWYLALLILIAGVGLTLRWVSLKEKPVHADEAVHAYKLGELLEGEGYEYDPWEYHGPTLNYLSLPVALLWGQDSFADLGKAAIRLIPVLCGILLVLGA